MDGDIFPVPNGVFRRWSQGLAQAARATVRLARDVALPTLCLSCRAPVAGEGLCAACWARASFIARPYCERLGTPFTIDGGNGQLSMEAVAHPPAYHRARAVMRYDDIARALVHALKYHDRMDLAPAMGRWMARAGADLFDEADALIPVPLHWRRGWSRRYNQSGTLAKVIGAERNLPVLHRALRRSRRTLQQMGLSRTERTTNVRGAFRAADPDAITGKRLILIDDVLTTGATTEACAAALTRAGAVRVDVLVFARVVAGGEIPI
jgi:ComF family protein